MGLEYSIRDGVGEIVLSRPDVLNALNDELLLEIASCIDAWEWDPEVQAILLIGQGKAFSSGSDIKEMSERDSVGLARHQALGERICERISDLPKPVVAAIHGYCLGGGMELALAADLRIAGRNAVFGLPEVRLNAIPSWGGTQRLPLVVGLGRALEMVLIGDHIPAEKALEWGLVNDVVPDDDLRAKAYELCLQLGRHGPAVALLKTLVRKAVAPSPAGRALEGIADSVSAMTSDFKAAVSEFAEPKDIDD